MRLFTNDFNSYRPPRIFLCLSDKSRIGELTPAVLQGSFKFVNISEISFDVYRYFTDVLSGETRLINYYNQIEAFYLIYLEGFGYFQLQDCRIVAEGSAEHKECVAYSSEYNLTQKYLEKFSVNAGTDISIESDDIVYEVATTYDPDVLYYTLQDGVYIKATIEDQYEFADGTYYINNTRVRLYYPEKPQLSLLHRILEKAPDWSIGYVSRSLMFQERTFEIERESIYDFICNTLCPAFHCIAVFDTVNNTINFYPEDENDETGDFDSDIYISFDNLATEMKVEYSADDIKTVLKVTGDSELDIRTVNLGSAALTDLSWFHTRERMGDDLYEKYAQYVEYCAEKSIQYEELWEEYDALYSEKLILENKIPSSDFVLKLGDDFEKLYCIYYPVYADDASQSEIDSAVDTSISALTEKLRMYHLSDTTNARTDSVLLTLKSNNLSATFRLIYDNGSYSIRLIITDPDVSTTTESIYTIEEWVRGEISIASKAAVLNGYSISYIGTLGAFFCIAKDETKPATLQEYGLNLLMTERKKYQTVQSVQVSGGLAETSNRFDDDDFERMMSEIPPSYPGQGVLWLDRSTTPSTILVYKNGSWVVPTSASDIRYAPKDYENFIRYLDNLVKLYCINQEIAVRQQQISELNVQITLNGVRRSDITASCEMATFFTPDEYKRLSYFLREDEYNDTSFVTTQYMTEQEVQSVKHALLDAGKKELSKLCAPQLKFSASIANIMAIPAFAALLSQFELGKFVHVELRDDFIKVVRLLQVDVNFFSLDDFTCTFGDMLESKNQADIHAELLAQATTMAKSVAANSSNWQKAATQASEIDNKITDGLISANTALKTNAVDQAIEWNDTGFHLRKWKDESRTEYDDLQGWLTNNGIYFTSDGWKSSDPLYSKFTVNGVEYTGVIAKAVIGGLLSGTYIEGGEIDIGNGNFKVTADGKVSMKAAEIENYINSSEFSEVTGKMMYRVELYSSGPTLFTDPNQQTTLFCKVYSWDDDITDDLNASLFTWKYNSGTSSADEVFATGVKTITVNSSKINKNSRFYCEVNL